MIERRDREHQSAESHREIDERVEVGCKAAWQENRRQWAECYPDREPLGTWDDETSWFRDYWRRMMAASLAAIDAL